MYHTKVFSFNDYSRNCQDFFDMPIYLNIINGNTYISTSNYKMLNYFMLGLCLRLGLICFKFGFGLFYIILHYFTSASNLNKATIYIDRFTVNIFILSTISSYAINI